VFKINVNIHIETGTQICLKLNMTRNKMLICT